MRQVMGCAIKVIVCVAKHIHAASSRLLGTYVYDSWLCYIHNAALNWKKLPELNRNRTKSFKVFSDIYSTEQK